MSTLHAKTRLQSGAGNLGGARSKAANVSFIQHTFTRGLDKVFNYMISCLQPH